MKLETTFKWTKNWLLIVRIVIFGLFCRGGRGGGGWYSEECYWYLVSGVKSIVTQRDAPPPPTANMLISFGKSKYTQNMRQ